MCECVPTCMCVGAYVHVYVREMEVHYTWGTVYGEHEETTLQCKQIVLPK